MSNGKATFFFFFYAFLNGITLTPILLQYTKASIFSTFLVTAVTFGVTSFYGYTTKKDLTSLRGLVVMGIIGLLVASVVNISDSGVLIETTIPILTQQIKIMAPPKNREKLEVYAELVYSISLAKDRFRCGLSFLGDPVEIARFVGSLTGFPGNQDEE